MRTRTTSTQHTRSAARPFDPAEPRRSPHRCLAVLIASGLLAGACTSPPPEQPPPSSAEASDPDPVEPDEPAVEPDPEEEPVSAEDELLELWSQFHQAWIEQAAAPARVRRAVFADTAARVGTEDAWRARAATVRAEGMDAIVDLVLARFFSPAFRESGDPVVARLGAFLRTVPVDGYGGSCDALAAADLCELARRVEARSLVIVGTADEATPPADARALHALLPDAELIELSGAGHLANLEQPVRFEALVSEFLTHEFPRDDQEVARA